MPCDCWLRQPAVAILLSARGVRHESALDKSAARGTLRAHMSCRDLVGACLFYADCLFDVLLALHLFETGHPSWGSLIIAFITLQYITAWLSVLSWFHARYGFQCCYPNCYQCCYLYTVCSFAPLVTVAWLCFGFPVGLLVLDVVMLLEPLGLYRLLPNVRTVPSRHIVFPKLALDPGLLRLLLPPYRAMRTLVEASLQSLPQVLLQAYILKRVVLDGIAEVSCGLLVQSLALSLLHLAMVGYGVVETAREADVSMTAHLWLQFRMGVVMEGPITHLGDPRQPCYPFLQLLRRCIDGRRLWLWPVLVKTCCEQPWRTNFQMVVPLDALRKNTITEWTCPRHLLGDRDFMDEMDDGEGDLADPATEALVKLLAAALRTNTSLLALDLSESGLGVEGCTKLASALKLNSTLTMLDLARNKIGEEGATAIADVLMSANSAITDLHVGGNDLSDSARQCLEDAWKSRDRNECGLRL